MHATNPVHIALRTLHIYYMHIRQGFMFEQAQGIVLYSTTNQSINAEDIQSECTNSIFHPSDFQLYHLEAGSVEAITKLPAGTDLIWQKWF